MSARYECVCPGSPLAPGEPCGYPMTQEDLLCDHCRELDCPTITSWAIRADRMHQQMVRVAESLKALS